jgi:hypothetical protein
MEYEPDLRSKNRNDDEEAQETFTLAKRNFSPLYSH